jgi:hypothetical protein
MPHCIPHWQEGDRPEFPRFRIGRHPKKSCGFLKNARLSGRGGSCAKSVPIASFSSDAQLPLTWGLLCANLLKELKFHSRTGGLDHVRDVGVDRFKSCHPDQSREGC